MLADHEGKGGFAIHWNKAGWHTAVLRYRTQCPQHPAPLGEGPLRDAVEAMRWLRKNAETHGIDAGRIAVIGSSAGGHLAASLAVHGEAISTRFPDPTAVSVRPDALLLCYAVLVAGENAHTGSIRNLCGEPGSDPEREAFFSLERHITKETPPTFLWHTADDASVPVENALAFAHALRKANRPLSLHVFPHGRHGLGLAEDDPVVGVWPHLANAWLKSEEFPFPEIGSE